MVKNLCFFARILFSVLGCFILKFCFQYIVITINLNILNIILAKKFILNGTNSLGAPRIFSKIYTVVLNRALDSRCQPFLARRGPVVHLADLRLREYARRGPVVHRATSRRSNI